jgi:hypothetical protein
VLAAAAAVSTWAREDRERLARVIGAMSKLGELGSGGSRHRARAAEPIASPSRRTACSTDRADRRKTTARAIASGSSGFSLDPWKTSNARH